MHLILFCLDYLELLDSVTSILAPNDMRNKLMSSFFQKEKKKLLLEIKEENPLMARSNLGMVLGCIWIGYGYIYIRSESEPDFVSNLKIACVSFTNCILNESVKPVFDLNLT